MKLPLRGYPLDKPFELQPATTPFSEVVLRLVLDLNSDRPSIIGSATVIAPRLAVTARHTLLDLVTGGSTEIHHQLVALQIVPENDFEYVVWDVAEVVLHPSSDIAVLHFGADPARSGDGQLGWKSPIVNPLPPIVDEVVAAVGYRLGSIATSKNPDGSNHLELVDEPMVSTGIVREVHHLRRDSRLDFPCFHIGSRFDGGMSGGPIFDEAGHLCGLICSGLDESDSSEAEPVSYGAALWPLFGLLRDQKPMFLDMARRGTIAVPDVHQLEKILAAPGEFFI